MSVTTVRLQPELEESLGAMAEKLQRSKSWLINQALREFFERQEQEQNRWQETLQAMESVAQGKVVSAEAVNTWLQSWGSANELSPPKAGE
ncbi:CopG family ribbon-helix-helix protein [Pseudomonas sp.]|uniref:CopG family ribbon-helix-helix protein n=1 Tax=Pseudomonas sp. TaxID=306 RepID=UPI002CACB304|nr:ribbon-helix-helix protein, CopG family [Pseudomonas sp.]HUE93320.1 ribbon-helix-helix protein, CopG family [Pseudomonas sp.]